MDKFSVGEVAILQSLDYFSRYNGMECTVIGGLGLWNCFNHRTQKDEHVFGYRVDLPCHYTCGIVEPHQLRKRRPPPDWVKLCNLTDVPREVDCV